MDIKRDGQLLLLISVKDNDVMHLGPVLTRLLAPPSELATPAVLGASFIGIGNILIQHQTLIRDLYTYCSILCNCPDLKDVYLLSPNIDFKDFHASYVRDEVGPPIQRNRSLTVFLQATPTHTGLDSSQNMSTRWFIMHLRGLAVAIDLASGL
jgi:hypothetical protein